MGKFVWRSIWERKSRTILTVLMLGLALFLLGFFRCMQEATYDRVIYQISHFMTGTIRIAHPDWLEKPTPYNNILLNSDLTRRLDMLHFPWSPRVEGYALMAFGERTIPVALTGIDPERESSILFKKSGMGSDIGLRDIFVGTGIARRLRIRKGDEVALVVQGIDGSLGADLFKVRSIIQTGFPELDRNMIWLHIASAQSLLALGNHITGILFFTSPNTLSQDRERIYRILHEGQNTPRVRVYTWEDIMPEIAQFIQLDRSSGWMYYMILLGVVLLGLLNTVFMNVYEQRKVLVILKAVGFSDWWLYRALLTQSLIYTFLGTALGFLALVPVLFYFQNNPIMLSGGLKATMELWGFEPAIYIEFTPRVLVEVLLISFSAGIFFSVFPWLKVRKIKIASAIRTEVMG